jgi:hypothetical protein
MPSGPPILPSLRDRILSRASGTGRHVISFAIGLLMALVLHYVLYRVGLPSKPFIYVAF